MANFKVGQKVIYNIHKDSIHHIGEIVTIDEFIHVQFKFGKPLIFPLSGYDKLFDRQLKVIDNE